MCVFNNVILYNIIQITGKLEKNVRSIAGYNLKI